MPVAFTIASIHQIDFERLPRSGQLEFRFFKAGRPHLLLWIIGSAVTFLRHAHKILVQLLVHVFVVEHRDSVNTFPKLLELNLCARSSRVNLDRLSLDGAWCVVRETLGAPEQSRSNLSFGVSCACNVNCQSYGACRLRFERTGKLGHQRQEQPSVRSPCARNGWLESFVSSFKFSLL